MTQAYAKQLAIECLAECFSQAEAEGFDSCKSAEPNLEWINANPVLSGVSFTDFIVSIGEHHFRFTAKALKD